jgi:integrase/recombinase XerC
MAAAPVSGGSSPEVAGFLADLRVRKAASVQTLRCYQADLEQFLTWLIRSVPSGGQLRSVTRLTVREFLAYLQSRNYARRTMARKLSCLKSFLTTCVELAR